MDNIKHFYRNHRAVIFAFLAFSAFAASDVLIKLSTRDVSIMRAIFWNDITALTLIALALATGKFGHPSQIFTLKSRKWHILRGFFLGTNFAFVVSAISVLPISTVYSIQFTAPAATALLAMLLLRERAYPFHWIAIGLGFIGVLLILRPGVQPLEIGHFYSLMSIAFLSGTWIVSRKIPEDDPALAFAVYPALFVLLISGAFIFPDFSLPPPGPLLFASTAAIFGVSGAIFLGKAFAIGPAATVSPMMYFMILWATLFGWLIFGDPFDLWAIPGTALVIASGIYLILKENKAKRA